MRLRDNWEKKLDDISIARFEKKAIVIDKTDTVKFIKELLREAIDEAWDKGVDSVHIIADNTTKELLAGFGEAKLDYVPTMEDVLKIFNLID